MLPQISSLPRLVGAHDLPGLISNLNVPVLVLLSVLSVPISLFLDKFPGLWILDSFASVLFPIFILSASPGLPHLPGVWHGARAPGPHLQAVHALLRLAGAGLAHLEFGQVWTARASKLRGRHNMPRPMLESASTGFGALGPRGELRHDAILLARNEASLFQERLGLEVLTDDVLGRHVFVFLDARYLSHLNTFVSLDTLQGFL